MIETSRIETIATADRVTVELDLAGCPESYKAILDRADYVVTIDVRGADMVHWTRMVTARWWNGKIEHEPVGLVTRELMHKMSRLLLHSMSTAPRLEQAIAVTIPWQEIHRACTAIDRVRGPLGNNGVSDVFGGTYRGSYFENQGLAGLVKINTAADTLARDAWDTVHRSVGEIRISGAPEGRLRGKAAKERAVQNIRQAVHVALLLHDLRTVLHGTGVANYDPENVICGQHKGVVHLTGLSWIAGRKTDLGRPSLDACVRFVAGEDPSVFLEPTEENHGRA